MNQRLVQFLSPLFIIIFLGACQRDPVITTTPAAEPTPAVSTVTPKIVPIPTTDPPGPVLLISEVLPGIEGANNHEFVELYNPHTEAVDLNGWTLSYLTRSEQEESPIIAWDERAEVPGLGHYLLVREGESFGLLPDEIFDVAMFEGKGGLILRNAEGTAVDRFGWGEAPEGYYDESPIVKFEKGDSLERLPGGEKGNSTYSANNAKDFAALKDPVPQNSGSRLTPLPEERLIVTLDYPQEISPGSEFSLNVNIENRSEGEVNDVLVSIPVADHFTQVTLPDGAEIGDGRVTWTIEHIGAGETHSNSVILSAPFANVDTTIRGFYAESAGQARAYGEPQVMKMDGSAIPIAMARSLPEGSNVTVEGVVTMYPGGFFAGSSSAKFYVEDDTGGVQVFADGGRFDVSVNLGDLVRVSGRTELYRDSLEVIPDDNLNDIEVLDNSGQPPNPTDISVPENETSKAVLGRLNAVEGTAVRLDEFNYHYEMELEDESGNRTLLYLEKDTGINADQFELGQSYRVSGISEFASGVRQLKPRLQSDFVEIFPPVLMLEVSAPTNVLPGETMPLAITAVNHTSEPMTNVRISATVGDSVVQEWLVFNLESNGGSESVTVDLPVPADAAGIADAGAVSAVSDQWLEPVVAVPNRTYVGEGLPIWAIQGDGSRSPLIGERVTTVGSVTGVFPEMDGFFIQSLKPDGKPVTSDGIFVTTGLIRPDVRLGDVVEVNGRVREDSGQTILQPAAKTDILIRTSTEETTVDPVVYDPPADPQEAETYKESLEGMLVTVNQPATVIGPTNRYGESILIYDKWGTDSISRRDGPVGYMMWVDDGTFNSHEDQSTLPIAVARGDKINEVTGPLAFTFGNFKIAPVSDLDVEYVEKTMPALPETADNQFTVATFNVENMFDSQLPHPDSPPRPSQEEYQRDLQRVADAIVAMGAPTIVALQEVENIAVLQELAQQPQLSDYQYEALLLEGNDSRGIDSGYLVRQDQATVEEVAVEDAPGELFSRPPLVVGVTVHFDSGDRQLILLNNHFLSLSAGEVQTEPVRNGQAAWNVSLIEQLKNRFPDAEFIVLGDLNSFYQTKPLNTLQDSGLRHAYEIFDEEAEYPYTYVFEGATQTIDHILMSEPLFSDVTDVAALHINADYPLPHPDDMSARRVSDHDPLVVTFTVSE